MEVVPNMIDPTFDAKVTTCNPDSPVITYIGRLAKSKGVKYLIEAAKYIDTFKEIRIVGDGYKREAFEKHANRVAKNINFVGKVPYDEISKEYAKADLFVHPGVWPEPFGRTILEAMQSALPIVATDRGGPSEIIPDSRCLCKPGDPKALASTINQTIPDANQIGEKNKEIAYDRYSPDKITNEIIKIYKSELDTSEDHVNSQLS
jgi:glycosyltransferase involved in cell wall biosynthesis